MGRAEPSGNRAASWLRSWLRFDLCGHPPVATMLGMVRLVIGGCLLVLWACGGSAPPPPSENVLELEVGGDNKPLSLALRALQPAAERRPAALPEPRRESAAEPPPVRPAVRPAVQSEPAAATHTVRLGRDQTVVGLAREHLGSDLRWREILELNGWTEADAKRLPVGTVVVLPRR